jgi:hypothetical protein
MIAQRDDRRNVQSSSSRGRADLLGLDSRAPRLEGAEEVGPEEADLGAPEREDDERDRDPARPAGDAVRPERVDRQRDRGSGDACERAAREGVRVPVRSDVDAHRVGGGRCLADRADVQAEPGAIEVPDEDDDERPGEVDEEVVTEEDRADDRPVLHRVREDRRELVRGRVAGKVEIVAEVRREPDGAGEDREREPRDDLVRPESDHEEGVDRGHREPGQGRHDDPERERGGRPDVEALNGPEAHDRADEHHPLDTEVQHARPLCQQLPERRKEKRCPVGDARGDHDDEKRVVHAASGVAEVRSGRTSRTR